MKFRPFCGPRAVAVLVACTVAIVPAGAQSAVSGDNQDAHAAVFDLQDRRAQAIIWTVRCAQHVARLRSDGRFGPIESLGTTGMCVPREEGALGIFIRADSTLSTLLDAVTLDLSSEKPYTGTLDSAAILAQVRASRDAILRGVDTFVQANRRFAPLAIRPPDDSLQVWLVPLDILFGDAPQAVGGALVYLYSPDGRTLVREVSEAHRFRPIRIEREGPVVIESTEDSMPLMSEFLAANVLAELGRTVTIRTAAYESTLTSMGPSTFWMHVPRR